jgi:hypothetical protein
MFISPSLYDTLQIIFAPYNPQSLKMIDINDPEMLAPVLRELQTLYTSELLKVGKLPHLAQYYTDNSEWKALTDVEIEDTTMRLETLLQLYIDYPELNSPVNKNYKYFVYWATATQNGKLLELVVKAHKEWFYGCPLKSDLIITLKNGFCSVDRMLESNSLVKAIVQLFVLPTPQNSIGRYSESYCPMTQDFMRREMNQIVTRYEESWGILLPDAFRNLQDTFSSEYEEQNSDKNKKLSFLDRIQSARKRYTVNNKVAPL